jgi:ribosomal protein S1
MIDKFALEQRIMDCWRVVDDIKTVYSSTDILSEDELQNALLGLHTIYQLKFEQLFSEFESSIEDEPKTNRIEYEPDQVVTGFVKSIKDYGLIIELYDDPDVEVLLHITDVSWKRLRTLDDKFVLDQSITVTVLNYDSVHNRMSVGLKQLTTDPFKKFAAVAHSVGDTVCGRVTQIVDYGIFIEIEDSEVEGLVHVSEIDWLNKNINPHECYSIGEVVSVKIIEINPYSRRVSLSIKSTLLNPWEQFDLEHNVGDIIDVEITSVTDLGFFVRPLEGTQVDILVRGIAKKVPERKQKIRCQLDKIDADRERVLATLVDQVKLTDYNIADQPLSFTPKINWRYSS